MEAVSRRVKLHSRFPVRRNERETTGCSVGELPSNSDENWLDSHQPVSGDAGSHLRLQYKARADEIGQSKGLRSLPHEYLVDFVWFYSTKHFVYDWTV